MRGPRRKDVQPAPHRKSPAGSPSKFKAFSASMRRGQKQERLTIGRSCFGRHRAIFSTPIALRRWRDICLVATSHFSKTMAGAW
jgi:hypothetical protein